MVQRDDVDGAISLNGHGLSESKKRGLYRYLHDGVAPSFFKADERCCYVGVRIDDFLSFAEARGLYPFAAGKAPAFEAENLTKRDLTEIAASWPLPAGEVEMVALVGDGV